jgi:hypothetical protein
VADEPTAAYTCWINGKRYDGLIENPQVEDLRRLAGVPDGHDFFVEHAVWDDHHLRLRPDPGGEDTKLDDQYRTIHLSVVSRFFSAPRFINAA